MRFDTKHASQSTLMILSLDGTSCRPIKLYDYYLISTDDVYQCNTSHITLIICIFFYEIYNNYSTSTLHYV